MFNNRSNNIYIAFKVLLDEFNKEIDAIEKKVQESFKIGKFTDLKKEIKYAEQLSSFRKKVASLLTQWEELFPHKEPKKRGSRLPPGVKTPSKAFYRPILKAIIDLGGKARVSDVLLRVGKAMKSILKAVDYEPLPSNPKEPRWVNTAKWARKDMTMMKPSLLKPDSPSKVWEITEAGRRFLMEGDR